MEKQLKSESGAEAVSSTKEDKKMKVISTKDDKPISIKKGMAEAASRWLESARNEIQDIPTDVTTTDSNNSVSCYCSLKYNISKSLCLGTNGREFEKKGTIFEEAV